MTRVRARSGGPWEERIGYARAVRAGDRAWVSGTTGTLPDGTIPGDVAEQARVALEVIARALSDVGADVDDVVAARIFVTDIADWEAVGAVLGRVFASARPAMTMVEVSALIDPAHRVEIEVEAVIDPSR